MNELALFAGAGGGLLGAELLGHRVVCAVEKDAYCVEILLRRQEEGHLPPFPVWSDARTFDGTAWRGVVDIVSAGFPCQPFSSAGKRAGEADERNLWPETIRIIREVKPRWVLLENVSSLLRFPYFGRILADLAASGFVGRYDCIPASAVGAPHRRDRLWIMAHAPGERCGETGRLQHGGSTQRTPRSRSSVPGAEGGHELPEAAPGGDDERLLGAHGGARSQTRDYAGDVIGGPEMAHAESESERPGLCEAGAPGDGRGRSGDSSSPAEVLDAQRQRLQGEQPPRPAPQPVDGASRTGQPGPQAWPVEPGMGRVAHGVAHRVDRIRALGNGQVPRVEAAAYRALSRKVKA